MLCLALALFATQSAHEAVHAAPPRAVAIRAEHVWLGDGRVLDKGIVIMSEGHITDVGTDIDVPAGMGTIEHKGTLTAGLVSLHGYSGSPGDMHDDTRPDLPGAKVASSFDSTQYDFEDAREAGITTLVLTPMAEGVAPGIAAVVKSLGGTIVSDEAMLTLVFTENGLNQGREPTSISGAMKMMEQMFQSKVGVIERAADGKLPCLFEVGEKHDISRALEFARAHKLRGAVHGVALAGEMAEEIHAADLDVIVPALGVGTERRALKAVIKLHKEGVRFGFGLDSPFNNPAQLRLSVVMCVREGLEPQVAWTALTSDAARIAGAGDRLGRIEKGLDADVVLWSGDPLDLGSRIEAVYVGGVEVPGEGR
jgi:imidazolonepropionase-like amidohydrolase